MKTNPSWIRPRRIAPWDQLSPSRGYAAHHRQKHSRAVWVLPLAVTVLWVLREANDGSADNQAEGSPDQHAADKLIPFHWRSPGGLVSASLDWSGSACRIQSRNPGLADFPGVRDSDTDVAASVARSGDSAGACRNNRDRAIDGAVHDSAVRAGHGKS